MYNKIINMIKMKRVKVITMAEKGNIYIFFKEADSDQPY